MCIPWSCLGAFQLSRTRGLAQIHGDLYGMSGPELVAADEERYIYYNTQV